MRSILFILFFFSFRLLVFCLRNLCPTQHHKDFIFCLLLELPWWLRGESICLECGRPGFNSWVGKIPWRRKWQPTPVLLPGESHGGRSLVGYSPWGRKESDTTERLHSLGEVKARPPFGLKRDIFRVFCHLECLYLSYFSNKLN